MGLRTGKGINYHGLGEKFFLKIIDVLDSVKEAYRGTKNASKQERSENYFLLISTFTDKNGDIINVPVYINEHGNVNNVFLDVNKISTVFGRKNLREYIKRQVTNGDLVRIKNRSNQASESNAPIARDYGETASTRIIRNEEPVVNNESQEIFSEYVSSKYWQTSFSNNQAKNSASAVARTPGPVKAKVNAGRP